jgi:signal peptidase I
LHVPPLRFCRSLLVASPHGRQTRFQNRPCQTGEDDQRRRAGARRQRQSHPVNRGRWLWENIKSLAGAVLIYLVVKTLLIEAFRIPSGSMIPTLLIGDWLFVNKLVYGPTVPFTEQASAGLLGSQAQRLSWCSCRRTSLTMRPDFTPTLVKRLIGMPGDTLYMRDGKLFRNGIAQPQGFPASVNYKGDGSATSPLFVWQQKHRG